MFHVLDIFFIKKASIEKAAAMESIKIIMKVLEIVLALDQQCRRVFGGVNCEIAVLV